MKKFGFGAFALIGAVAGAAVLIHKKLTTPPTVLCVDGEEIDEYAKVFFGRTFVPIEPVFYELGWDITDMGNEIICESDEMDLRFTVGKDMVLLDDEALFLDVPVFRLGEDAYVPLRFLTNTLGIEAEHFEEDGVSYINLLSEDYADDDFDDEDDEDDEDDDDGPGTTD